jgi:Ca-activated chloride channel family protein
VFTLRVGNILPGERVTVALTLASPLAFADGQAEFRFPLVVAPRYIPGTPLPGQPVGDGYAPDTGAVPDASRITPPVLLPGFPNPVDLSIEVRLDPAGLPHTGVASSLHAVTETDGVLRIQPGERVDRDFILRLSYGDVRSALALAPDPVERPAESGHASPPERPRQVQPAGGTYRLTILPPESDAPPRPKDLVLLLDRSASMGGWKMVTARRAAARIVDTLTDRDRFAVLTFDRLVHRPDGLPEGLVAGTDRNRYRAVEHLAGAHAAGGTEMLTPLREGLRMLTDPSRDRVLVLVTDGQVGNEDELIREIGAEAGVRIHSVGVDRAVNAGFLGRLATIGGGRCELVESEDRLDAAMERIHRRIAAPLVTGLRMHAEGLDLVDGTLAPARIPDLFPGVPLVIAGRYRGAAQGTVTVTGTGRDGGAWRVEVPATVVDSPASSAIWARAHLRDLEDRYAVTGGRELERDIVATSLRFGVLCRFTAYVAVDPRVVAEGSPAHRVIQPVELPSGWTGMPMPVAGMSAAGMPVAGGSAAGMPVAGMPTPGGAPTPPRGPMAPMAMTMRAQVWQALAGPRLARTRRTTGPASRGGAAQPTAESSVVRLIVREVRALREAAGTPEPQRAELLDDLASRLDAQATWLGSGPLAAALRELATALRDDSLPLAERWSRALAQLDRLAAGASVQAPPPGSAAEAPPAGPPGQELPAGRVAQEPPIGPPAEAPPAGPAAREAGPPAGLPPQRRDAGEQAPASSVGEVGDDRRRGAFWRRDAGE